MKHYLSCFGFVLILFSCQTTRSISPQLNVTPREGLSLSTPIYIALKDNRTKDTDKDVLSPIRSGLKKAYGDNIMFVNYFEKTPANAILFKIELNNLEANFGTRTINYYTVHNEITMVSTAIATDWGVGVATAVSNQNYLQNNARVSGYWVGSTTMRIKIYDNVFSNSFEFPLVAEDTQSNMLVYKSANSAAQNSWNKALRNLIEIIDLFAEKLVELD